MSSEIKYKIEYSDGSGNPMAEPRVWKGIATDTGEAVTLFQQATGAGDSDIRQISIEIKSTCCWCGRELIEHLPRQKSDPALVRRMNDTVICHSCVKHLAVIVLDQECRTEREEHRAMKEKEQV